MGWCLPARTPSDKREGMCVCVRVCMRANERCLQSIAMPREPISTRGRVMACPRQEINPSIGRHYPLVRTRLSSNRRAHVTTSEHGSIQRCMLVDEYVGPHTTWNLARAIYTYLFLSARWLRLFGLLPLAVGVPSMCPPGAPFSRTDSAAHTAIHRREIPQHSYEVDGRSCPSLCSCPFHRLFAVNPSASPCQPTHPWGSYQPRSSPSPPLPSPFRQPATRMTILPRARFVMRRSYAAGTSSRAYSESMGTSRRRPSAA